MGAGGVMGAMTDFDIAYGIVAVDKTAAGVNSAVSTTQSGTKSIAEQFFFMSQAVNQAIAYINQGFDATVGAALKWADSLKKASDITGISTDNLQRLKAAGLEVGVSQDAINMTARMMTQRLGDTGAAGDELRQSLKELGVTTVDSNGNLRNTYDIYMDVIQALHNVDNPLQRNALGVKALGRSWYEVAPAIQDYERFARGAANATVVPPEEIENAHQMGIEMDKLNAKLAANGRTIGTELLPATEEWMDLITSVLSKDTPIMGFFGWLNDMLVRSAQGFHIVGSAATAVATEINQIAHGDFAGAGKTSADFDESLNKWMAKENYDDWFRKNGWTKDENGNWANPALKRAAPAVSAPVAEFDKESDRVTALTDAYKDWDTAIRKVNDDKSKGFEDERSYYEGILETGGDYSKIRSLTSAHKKAERAGTATIAEDTAAANEAAVRYNEIKAGTPLAQVKGTSQYTTAQAQNTDNSLSIGVVNLYGDKSFEDYISKYEKHLTQQRKLKGINTGSNARP